MARRKPMSQEKVFASAYGFAQADVLELLAAELVSMQEGADDAQATGDTEREQWCKAMADVLRRIRSEVGNLAPDVSRLDPK